MVAEDEVGDLVKDLSTTDKGDWTGKIQKNTDDPIQDDEKVDEDMETDGHR